MSYGGLWGHRPMVFDERRNGAYAEAISRAVGKASVVLDLGAGAGVHGLLAARAGAERVYLVEPEPIIDLARAAASEAGVAARIHILQGRIEDVTLPEPVDLIISALTGNLLFSEDLLPALVHARRRWLKPGGALLPSRAQLVAAPVEAALLHRDHVSIWDDATCGLRFPGARTIAANEIAWLGDRRKLEGVSLVAPGQALVDRDFHLLEDTHCDGDAIATATENATCHGLLAWIRLQLGASWFDTGPQSPPTHWTPVFLPVDPPLPISAGEAVRMRVHRPPLGDWTWSIEGDAGTRRQSTFFSHASSAEQLRRLDARASVALGAKGARLLRILECLRDGLDLAACAQRVGRDPDHADRDPLDEVREAALRWGVRR